MAGHLNGLQGVCERWDDSTGRWIVRLETGDLKKLRPANCVIEVPPLTTEEIKRPPRRETDCADVAARFVLRASCVVQLSMTAAQLVHPDAEHQHLYEIALDTILPIIGLKASLIQKEASTMDNLQLVAGISAFHAGEILHNDGIMKAVMHGIAPQCPHAMQLGLFFLGGTSAWLVRQKLPFKEGDKGWKGLFEDSDEEHENEDEADEGAESELPDMESDGFEGFIEDPASSAADPYPEACRSEKY
jgi:hypothetical protein